MTKDAFFELVAKLREVRAVVRELDAELKRRDDERDALRRKADAARDARDKIQHDAWTAIIEVDL
jgi:outer membrane murein-binding lipoprotein Lpp